MDLGELRAAVEADIAAGRSTEAAAGLRTLWRRDASSATARFINQQFERLAAELDLVPLRLAILRSYTVEPLLPLLQADAFAAGIRLEMHVGEFNVWAQSIFDPSSALYDFDPQAVILALDAPEPAAVEEALAAFRTRSDAAVIVHNRAKPAWPSLGLYDAQADVSQREAAHDLNRELRATVRRFRSAFVLDYDALISRVGADGWLDRKKWAGVRLPVASQHMRALVSEWMRFLHPLTGRIAKCAVVDLDNTLWSGVIGEDGMAGIRLDDAAPGVFYQELQRALLDLVGRGVLLAICSKNNPAEALEALEKHPGMVLRPDHFAAVRINWQDKVQNLRELAAELNIGVDALAFIDDNPAERENVRQRLPEVAVIDLPPGAEGYADAVRRAPVFERLELSTEDSQRTSMYAAQRRRRDAEQSSTSPEDFLRSLEQVVEIQPVTPLTLARVAQLTQKTNQFNLTTRRYTEQQLGSLAERGDCLVLTVAVRDRFGDNGLTGVAIARNDGDSTEIDTFLLSCRVIGRSVETALLARLEAEARNNGAKRLLGRFLPTKKNAPAKDFLAQHGFARRAPQPGDEGEVWIRDLEKLSPLETPDWVRVEVVDEALA